jgi:hypothetical protein
MHQNLRFLCRLEVLLVNFVSAQVHNLNISPKFLKIAGFVTGNGVSSELSTLKHQFLRVLYSKTLPAVRGVKHKYIATPLNGG